MRILLFCEAEADARTARALLDETVLFRCGAWVRDLYEQDPVHVRQWVPDTRAGRDWYDVHAVYGLAERLGVRRVHGHFGGERGQAGAVMVATIGRIARALAKQPGSAIDVLLLVWDMDDQARQRDGGLAQGASHVPPEMDFLPARPNPMRESWVLAGFEPADGAESDSLQRLRAELGFWPNELPHELTAKNDDAKLSAKRVARILAPEWDRELACLRVGTQPRRDLLQRRGSGCGLESYLTDIERTIVPRVDPSIVV